MTTPHIFGSGRILSQCIGSTLLLLTFSLAAEAAEVTRVSKKKKMVEARISAEEKAGLAKGATVTLVCDDFEEPATVIRFKGDNLVVAKAANSIHDLAVGAKCEFATTEQAPPEEARAETSGTVKAVNLNKRIILVVASPAWLESLKKQAMGAKILVTIDDEASAVTLRLSKYYGKRPVFEASDEVLDRLEVGSTLKPYVELPQAVAHRMAIFDGSPGLWTATVSAVDLRYGYVGSNESVKVEDSGEDVGISDSKLRINTVEPKVTANFGTFAASLAFAQSTLNTSRRVVIQTPSLGLALRTAPVLLGIDVTNSQIESTGDESRQEYTSTRLRVALGHAFDRSGLAIAYEPKQEDQTKRSSDGEDAETETGKTSSAAGLFAWMMFADSALAFELRNDFNDGEDDGEPLQEKLAKERISFRISDLIRLSQALRLDFGLARNRPGAPGFVPYLVDSPATGVFLGFLASPSTFDLSLFVERQTGGIERTTEVNESEVKVITTTSLTMLSFGMGVRL